MSDTNRIKQTLETPGWESIKDLLLQELGDVKKPKYLKTDGKSNERIVAEVLAYEMAYKMMKQAIKKVENIATDIKQKQQRLR